MQTAKKPEQWLTPVPTITEADACLNCVLISACETKYTYNRDLGVWTCGNFIERIKK